MVKKLVSENTFLLEAISKDLISYGNLAEQLKPEIEKELGKKVKEAAIVMALRRYAEELHGFDNIKIHDICPHDYFSLEFKFGFFIKSMKDRKSTRLNSSH